MYTIINLFGSLSKLYQHKIVLVDIKGIKSDFIVFLYIYIYIYQRRRYAFFKGGGLYKTICTPIIKKVLASNFEHDRNSEKKKYFYNLFL